MSQTKAQLIDGKAASVEFSGGSASTPSITFDGDVNTGIFSPAADTIAFAEGGSEAARIDSSGRLLVGTSTSLDLNAPIQAASTTFGVQSFRFSSSATGTGGAIDLARSNSGTVGTTSAIVSGQGLGIVRFRGAGDSSTYLTGAQIEATSDGGTVSATSMPTRLVFSTTADGSSSPTEAMRLDDEGRLFCTGVYNSTTASGANVRVDSNGHLQRSTSSAKYKTNIETLEDSYADALLDCRPVWYRSTCENDNPEHGWWGFIAEEVAEIDPRLIHWKTTEVTYDEKGSAVKTPCDPEPEGVAYDRFVPHLLNLIKRQKEQIESQATQLASFEARLAALETP